MIYQNNYQIIKSHNESKSSYQMGVNKFTFLNDDERIAFLGIIDKDADKEIDTN